MPGRGWLHLFHVLMTTKDLDFSDDTASAMIAQGMNVAAMLWPASQFCATFLYIGNPDVNSLYTEEMTHS